MIRPFLAMPLLTVLAGSALAQGLELPFKSNREIQEEQRREGTGAPTAGKPLQAPAQPILRMSFDRSEAIPGQPVTLRLTVLAPTYLSAPPVWPSFEAPNLLVRLPEGATTPINERIGGENWSGVSRRYQISPMIPGAFPLPAQEVAVTWSDPQIGKPAKTVLKTEPVTFKGVPPPGTEGLDPFIAADSLQITRQVEGSPQAMKPGDSVIMTLTATVRGVSPMFLPDLPAPSAIEGIAAYPDDPVVTETEERGRSGGTRVERVTLVAEAGGGGELPPLSLRWFDLETNMIETATVEGLAFSVEGLPIHHDQPRDWRVIAMAAAGAILAAAMVFGAIRWAAPRVRRYSAAWRGSEAHAWRQLRRTVAKRNHAALRPALDTWAARVEGADPRRDPIVRKALLSLGAARYGGEAAGANAAWRSLAAALPKARRLGRRTKTIGSLPPLNPVS
jgi:hypothetical protein